MLPSALSPPAVTFPAPSTQRVADAVAGCDVPAVTFPFAAALALVDAIAGPTLICVVPGAHVPKVASAALTSPDPATQSDAFAVSDWGATVTLLLWLAEPLTVADAGPTSMNADP